MTTNWKIIIVLGAVVFLLIAFKKPIKKAMTRGYRNNNPGNIRLTTTKWKGEIDGSDTAFKTFRSMPYGYRALYALLKEYMGKGYNTIDKIINRYAPGNENNTEAYIQTVEKKTGINRHTILTFAEKNNITNLVAAISYVENGVAPDLRDIDGGYKLLTA
jgi:hypothetical protein